MRPAMKKRKFSAEAKERNAKPRDKSEFSRSDRRAFSHHFLSSSRELTARSFTRALESPTSETIRVSNHLIRRGVVIDFSRFTCLRNGNRAVVIVGVKLIGGGLGAVGQETTRNWEKARGISRPY